MRTAYTRNYTCQQSFEMRQKLPDPIYAPIFHPQKWYCDTQTWVHTQEKNAYGHNKYLMIYNAFQANFFFWRNTAIYRPARWVAIL